MTEQWMMPEPKKAKVAKGELKSPADWCLVEGVEILDPDGWRGVNGRPWADLITLAEFRERLATCTQRPARPAGEHHVGTLALSGEGNRGEVALPALIGEWRQSADEDERYLNTKVHASEVHDVVASIRINREHAAALEAAYPAIRQQVAEEIAVKADAIGNGHQKSAEDHRAIALEIGSKLPKGRTHLTTAIAFKNQAAGAWEVAQAAREVGGWA